MTGKGDLAKCFCHEIDHLEGILFTINDFFIERFKAGMYSPSRADLDLEKSGVNLKEAIE